MRLQRLKISNFRCFGPIETEIRFDDFVALVGANSTGKTAIMHALLKVFGDADARELRRSDFHISSEVAPDSVDNVSLYIEAVLIFPELRDQQTGKPSVTVPPFFNQMVIDEPGADPYARVRLTAEWIRTSSPDGDIDSRLEFILAPEAEAINEKTPAVRMSAHQRSQVQVLYVPAIRDPNVHLRSHSTAILWRLLRAVKWSEGFRSEVKALSKNVDDLFLDQAGVATVQEVLQGHWSRLHGDGRYSLADIKFNPTELDDVLRRVQVGFRPTPEGGAYSVEQLGDGLRSMFYLSMVAMLLDIEDSLVQGSDLGIAADLVMSPALTVLALEEPENHLAPHLLGRVIEHCHEISSHSGCQVLISSHTPALLRRIAPEDIRYLRVDSTSHSSIISEISLPSDQDEAAKYVREAVRAYPEIYFSKVVVLGEGDSEEIVLSRAIEASGYGLDQSEVAVVPLGGRHVNHFWRLLDDLMIPHVTLLDLDLERLCGGWGRIQYAIKQLLAIGVSRDELLAVRRKGEPYVLSDAEVEAMSSWDVTKTIRMGFLMERLKEHGVFFSAPLDLDFLMLCAFPEEYKHSVAGGTGPRIPDTPKEREERLARAVTVVLGRADGQAQTYHPEEIEMFPWYTYLFLGRGKPATHLAALRQVDDATLSQRLPPILQELIKAISERLGAAQEALGGNGRA